MKSCLFPLFLATAGLTSPLLATPKAATTTSTTTQPRIAYSAAGRVDTPAPGITCGVTTAEVLDAIGEPSEQLSRDVWVYWNYRCTDPEAQSNGFDALLLRFIAGRVTHMRIGARADVEWLLARVRLATPLRTAGLRGPNARLEETKDKHSAM